MFFQNEALRSILISGYRAYARSMFWRSGPKLLINSFPKSGTHLLTTMLKEYPGLMDSGRFVWTKEITKDKRQYEISSEIDKNSLSAVCESIRRGQYFSAHFPWREEIGDVLANQNISVVFVIRDPRDIAVSRMHYIKNLRRHALHERMIGDYTSDADRLMACIKGIPESQDGTRLESLSEKILSMEGWLNCPNVLVMKFEDLIGAKGGGDAQRQIDILKKFSAHIGLPLSDAEIADLLSKFIGSTSFTFRKGVIGDWRNHFNSDHVDAIGDKERQLIARMGYTYD